MAIFVGHRRKKASGLDKAIRKAREMSRPKLDSMSKFLIAKEKVNKELDAAVIRRYAKKNGLNLQHHPKPWLFEAKSGEKIAMPAGYYAKVDGVLEEIVAR